MRTPTRRAVSAAVGTVLVLTTMSVLTAQTASATGALTAVDMNSGLTPEGLAQNLAGAGVSVSNVTYTGSPNAAGTFSGGSGAIGFPSGIVLSTGSVATDPNNADPCQTGIDSANTCDSNTTQNGTPGDGDLNALAGFPTYDASVLEFDFVPAGGTVTFQYVFGSEEYPEYANSVYNDVFAFYVNGQNCALVPGTNEPVSINTINGGNPLGTNVRNPQYYVDNHFDATAGSPLPVQMDGLTTVLTCTAQVSAGQPNHMKLAIADGSDQQLDSNVFLQSNSLVSQPDAVTLTQKLTGGTATDSSISTPGGTPVTDQAFLSGGNSSTAGGTVTYWAYQDSNCSTGATAAGTGTVVNGVAAPSQPLVLPKGTYYWQATYSGDAAHNPAGTSCGDGGTLTVTSDPNAPPTGTAAGPYVGQEGSPTYVTGSAQDVNNDPLTYSWSAAPQSGVDAGATCSFANPASRATTVTCTDDGIFTLTMWISDGANPPVPVSTTYTVSNVSPLVSIVSPTDMSTATVGVSTSVTAGFTDPGSNDTQTCSIDWGNGSVSTGYVSGGQCTGAYAYPALGVYTVTVTVTDDDGGQGSAQVGLVVVDPGAKITGGGFVTSGGRTNFGFVVMRMTDGTLKGQFEINGRGNGNGNGSGKGDVFHGDTVTSLSVTGNTGAWSGGGRFNNVTGYTFSASVVDNGNGGSGPADSIAVTVYSPTGKKVMSFSQSIKGGNIVIHT